MIGTLREDAQDIYIHLPLAVRATARVMGCLRDSVVVRAGPWDWEVP